MSDSMDKVEALAHDISEAVYQISFALVSIMDSEDIYHYHFEYQYKMAKKYIEDFEREEDPELVEQLRGAKKEWIYDEGIHNWRCSRCGQTPPPTGYVGNADFMATHHKFCSHCGADMRGE